MVFCVISLCLSLYVHDLVIWLFVIILIYLSISYSLTKSCAFIERIEGQQYAGLFMSVRLVGITDTRHIDDMLRMNVIPQQWILKALSMHYHALQGGGDMSLMLNFGRDSIRTGFIIDQV